MVHEPGVCLWRQDLDHHVGNIVVEDHKLESDELVRNPLTQSCHFDTEVSVAPSHNVIVDHDNTLLIDLVEERWCLLCETQFLLEVTQSQRWRQRW